MGGYIFFKAQGYKIKKNILFQYNQSTITIAKNGRDSCTISSRHIHIRHFFVKDRVYKVEIVVNYYPTHLMTAEYFTKPLQGQMFKMFCDLAMGYVHINDLLRSNEFSAKERVEKSKNVTANSITNNGKINYANVFKSSKNMDIEEEERKNILT